MKKLWMLAGLLAALSPLLPAQNPVVVELFTSEGCSSCPPADAVLKKLSEQGNSGLVLLGEHVDYWNYIGWTDRFSSRQFSERQSAYGRALHSSVYTPQMVIDGSEQFVGNDAAEVQQRIAAAARQAKPAQVTLSWEGKSRLHVSVRQPAGEPSQVLLAITENGLTTAVGAGENGGRTLHHEAVVRQLRPVGQPDKGAFEATLDVAPQADWDPAKLTIAVLVEDRDTMKMLGAAAIPYRH